ncbi:MAG: hypothetical protein QXY49_00950 [Thermofilaceae archaeon]
MKEWKLLVVLYEIPEKPSKIKVGCWRRLRRLGGMYPRLSLCVLPDTKEVRETLSVVLDEIRKWGTAIVLEGKPLSEVDTSQLRNALASIKEREYKEILEECNEFLSEIKENIDKGNLTQEEAEELEEILEALNRWYEHVHNSDWLEMRASEEVEKKLKECEKALEEFISLCLKRG